MSPKCPGNEDYGNRTNLRVASAVVFNFMEGKICNKVREGRAQQISILNRSTQNQLLTLQKITYYLHFTTERNQFESFQSNECNPEKYRDIHEWFRLATSHSVLVAFSETESDVWVSSFLLSVCQPNSFHLLGSALLSYYHTVCRFPIHHQWGSFRESRSIENSL